MYHRGTGFCPRQALLRFPIVVCRVLTPSRGLRGAVYRSPGLRVEEASEFGDVSLHPGAGVGAGYGGFVCDGIPVFVEVECASRTGWHGQRGVKLDSHRAGRGQVVRRVA